MTFGVDADGNYGYIKAGADTVTPFKSGGTIKYYYQGIFEINNVTHLYDNGLYRYYRVNNTWSQFVGSFVVISCITISGKSNQNPGIIYNGIYDGNPFNVTVYDGQAAGYPSRVTIGIYVVE